MPMYRVCGKVSGGKYLGDFEADSAEEAVEKALNSEDVYIQLCLEYSRQCENVECQDAEAELIDEERTP